MSVLGSLFLFGFCGFASSELYEMDAITSEASHRLVLVFWYAFKPVLYVLLGPGTGEDQVRYHGPSHSAGSPPSPIRIYT